MKRKAKAVLFSARTFIILGALLSLCASDNVGPCLLPMPFVVTVTQSTAIATPPIVQAGASHVPSRGRTAPDRIEMVAPTVQRSSVERHTLHLLAAALDSALYSAADNGSPATDINESSSYSPVFVSSTLGRAPPPTA